MECFCGAVLQEKLPTIGKLIILLNPYRQTDLVLSLSACIVGVASFPLISAFASYQPRFHQAAENSIILMLKVRFHPAFP